MSDRFLLERRERIDRRVSDRGPPTLDGERRICPERRRPVICYLDIDDDIEILPIEPVRSGTR